MLSHCPECGRRFSDWFTWTPNGLRHCFYCWMNSKYLRTVLENGQRIGKWPVVSSAVTSNSPSGRERE